jgi:hypothetical protein
MSERHYADWCKAKLGLSKEFEEGFNKGYEYAKATIKPQVVKEYVQDPVTIAQVEAQAKPRYCCMDDPVNAGKPIGCQCWKQQGLYQGINQQ